MFSLYMHASVEGEEADYASIYTNEALSRVHFGGPFSNYHSRGAQRPGTAPPHMYTYVSFCYSCKIIYKRRYLLRICIVYAYVGGMGGTLLYYK
jgi:hypothetical protein